MSHELSIPGIVRKDIDEHLDDVDYKELNSPSYLPSPMALEFMNFVKLVNGGVGEANKTPPFHLAMIDKVFTGKRNVANLCFRGAAKTTVFFEYFAPFVGVYNVLPNLGAVESMIYISDSMDNGVKSARRNLEFRYQNSDFLKQYLPKATFTDNWIEFINLEGKRLGIKMFGAKTGLRGTKIYGKRPVLAIMDDLISDDDADSPAAMDAIKNTVYRGVNYALDPTRFKKIFNGTPFNKEDIMVEAVESGAWDTNVWPACEKWPCTREEFVGAWPDRFSYDFLMEKWTEAQLTGKAAGFMQEMMLRISSAEERLIQEDELVEYQLAEVLNNRQNYNFYITTDFATSERQKADYTVLTVWAYNAHGEWRWVEAVVARQDMAKTFDDLFRLVVEWRPQSVGVEVTGQQGGFVSLLKQEMLRRNIFFTLASNQKNGQEGIRPDQSKLTRFNLSVPLFKLRKIKFPADKRFDPALGTFYAQIRLATRNGLKGKDDCLDNISQLPLMNPWKPVEGMGSFQDAPPVAPHGFLWDHGPAPSETHGMASYIV